MPCFSEDTQQLGRCLPGLNTLIIPSFTNTADYCQVLVRMRSVNGVGVHGRRRIHQISCEHEDEYEMKTEV